MLEKAVSQDPNVTLLLSCQILGREVGREGRGGKGREGEERGGEGRAGEGGEGRRRIPQKLDALRDSGILLLRRLGSWRLVEHTAV